MEGPCGKGQLDNDDALDFVGGVGNAPEAEMSSRLPAALSLPEGYLEAREGSSAIVAATLVAARNGCAVESSTVVDLLASRDRVCWRGAAPVDPVGLAESRRRRWPGWRRKGFPHLC